MFWVGDDTLEESYFSRLRDRVRSGAWFLRRRISLPSKYHKYRFQGEWYIVVGKQLGETGDLTIKLIPYEEWKSRNANGQFPD